MDATVHMLPYKDNSMQDNLFNDSQAICYLKCSNDAKKLNMHVSKSF